MAIIVNKKYPQDSDERISIGFRFPLDGKAVFNPTYQTKDQIKANLINYLLTNKKERIFNPNFGADLRSLLFENIDEGSLEGIKERIQNDIVRFFPQVVIQNINFITKPDFNTINFTLEYHIRDFGVEDTLNIELQ